MFIIAVCFVRYWKETPRSLRLKEQHQPFQSKVWRKTYWTVRMCCNMLLFEGMNGMLLNRPRNAIKTLCFPHLAVYESKWLSASFRFNEKVTWCSRFWNLMEPWIGLEKNKVIWPFAVLTKHSHIISRSSINAYICWMRKTFWTALCLSYRSISFSRRLWDKESTLILRQLPRTVCGNNHLSIIGCI